MAGEWRPQNRGVAISDRKSRANFGTGGAEIRAGREKRGTALPNIYNADQLKEFAAAPDLPDLTGEDLARIAELAQSNFGVEEAPMKLKGEPPAALQDRLVE